MEVCHKYHLYGSLKVLGFLLEVEVGWTALGDLTSRTGLWQGCILMLKWHFSCAGTYFDKCAAWKWWKKWSSCKIVWLRKKKKGDNFHAEMQWIGGKKAFVNCLLAVTESWSHCIFSVGILNTRELSSHLVMWRAELCVSFFQQLGSVELLDVIRTEKIILL